MKIARNKIKEEENGVGRGGQGNQQETSVIKNTPKVNLKEYYSGYSYKWVFSFFILELYHRLRISDIVYLFS